MTLKAGDVIATGTPSGVSKLNPGDVCTVEIEGSACCQIRSGDQILNLKRSNEIFIDTANLEEIREANELGLIDGVTTNPSLVAKKEMLSLKNTSQRSVPLSKETFRPK